MINLKDALSHGGWLVAGILAVGSFFAGDATNPSEHIASSPVFTESRCRDGWVDTSDKVLDVSVFTCAKGDAQYVLMPDGKTFERGRHGVGDDWNTNESQFFGE